MSEVTTFPPITETAHDHWTARFSRPVIFVIVTLIAVGVYLAFSIPVAVFPSTDFPRIVVGVDNGVAPINQMQVTVTRLIEEAMNSVPGLEKIRSTTSRGSAEVNLYFNWSVDMFQTLQYVNAALSRVQPSLPITAKLTSNRLTFAAFPILAYSLTSDTMPQTDLWELSNYTIKPRLNRVNGVSMVVLQGGKVPEFEIQPDPAKLLQAQVTVPAILDAVAKTNMIDSPGLIENNHELSLTLVSGQTRDPSQIANVVVRTTDKGVPVRIGDVAQVRPSVMPVYTIVTANGKPAVLLNIFRQPDSNTVTVAQSVGQELDNIKQTLPAGVKVQTYYDQSILVRDSIKSVRDAIVIGLILAAIILVLFLRDWGSSLVAGLVIPATIAITLIFLHALGQTFNLMTLGGLAAAVGLVIDDAIVVVENIVLHRDSGQSRAEAIRSALREIRVPLVGSTITPIVVFLPLISMTGVEGTFFRALAITVGTALLTSLGLALTWTPTLSHYLLRRQAPERASARADSHGHVAATGIMGRVTRAYVRALRFVLAYPVALAAGCLVLIVASYFCYRALGSDLLPAMDEGTFILDYLMPAGSSLEDTNQVLLGVEKILQSTPEVEGTSRRTGLQLGLAAVTEANTGDFTVRLKPPPRKSIDDVISDVRAKVTDAYPQLDVEFIQLLQDNIGDLTDSPEPMEVKLFSPDPNLLKEWGPKVAEQVKKIKGVVDVKDGIENTVSGTAITMSVDPVVAARSGFTPQEIELNASAILQGEPATTPVIVNDREYTIRVRFPDSARSNLDQIKNTVITSNTTGKTVTLGSVANFQTEPGQTEIVREDLQRRIAVTGRFEGMSLGAGMAQVQKVVAGMHLPSSIRIVYGGLYEEQQRSFRDLVVVLALAIVLVFTVLLIEFRNFAAPTAIIASALLSTSGVFLALLITGVTFNISSFMGLIMVIGIVAKNGILLLDADQRFRSEGYSVRDAMIEAGERRLRPILMTALATVAGMIPLSLAIGAGSQMLQPLAIAVIGGLLASMVLSLIVTPAVHYYLSRHD
ncbi:MAG: efflux RND transporter permease subunit [Bryobacterales bacterium]|nr:efflux RND transporter permease subunit [Bryobacterales bacterium]MBV9398109.1 efflux RND transporter permease subunit [Bryobacterales bacterium]